MKITKPKIVKKPWGREIWLAAEKEYAGKILEIRKGSRTSLHYHKFKKETMYVLEGELKLIHSGGEIIVREGECILLEPGNIHRIVPLKDLKIIEISTPQLDDVVRIEDDYGRD